MKTINYKEKIGAGLLVYLVAVVMLFGYFFKLFDTSNQAVVASILERRKTLFELQSERESFELGKKDITMLESKPLLPSNFFNNDINLVTEIRTLESTARAVGADLSLIVSGTVTRAPKAPTTGELYAVPYTMQVRGQFAEVVGFLEQVEQLPFVTHVRTVGLSNSRNGEVNALFGANFFVKK